MQQVKFHCVAGALDYCGKVLLTTSHHLLIFYMNFVVQRRYNERSLHHTGRAN